MTKPSQNQANEEIERLRKALDSETLRCLDLQRRLDQATVDFEEFVSLAAHDLREPLREIACFGQLIAETSATCLDSQCTHWLARIQDDVARVQSLLADVVDYWASSTGAPPSARIDMEAVLRQVLLFMDKQIAEGKAVVTHDSLPVVIGDSGLLIKVLRHLINNAIAYCDSLPVRVHVSSCRKDNEFVISVLDNGPGIDPNFHKRIFDPFRRLHGKEFPGSGLGLSFCSKAVRRLNGRIWIESLTGSGSKFCFTLPAAD